MDLYHVRMPKSWKGPCRVTLGLLVGNTRAHLAFHLYQEDEKASDYPIKKLWLTQSAALELKQKGFSVVPAKQPEVKAVQVKPIRQNKPVVHEEPTVKRKTKRQPKKEDAKKRSEK